MDREFIDSVSLFLLAVGVWVFYAYCWQKIAERTATDRAWWAWIPVLNVLLILRIAKRPLWWFLLFAVPFVNVYVAIRILVDICRAVGKSPWLAVPLFIPGVNLPLFPYLAGFTKTRMLKAVGAGVLLVVVFPLLPIVLGLAVWNSRSIQLDALKHPDISVRIEAAKNLKRICPKTQECVPALVEALHDPSSVIVRIHAADALGEIGPEAQDAVPALIEVVKKDEIVALHAIHTLGRIGPPAKYAFPVLMEARATDRLCLPVDTALERIGMSTGHLRPCR
jgi:hypothetical protein